MKISSAQTYHPFPDTLAQWSENYVYYGMCCSGYGYIFAMAGDTIIDNKVYSLLGYNSTYSWETYQYQSFENYPYDIPGTIFGALREDSSHKIWFRNFDSLASWMGCHNLSIPYFPFPVDSEMLLYDFELEVGDTAYWAGYEYNKVVKKIDSIQILDGSWRKVISFDLYNFYNHNFWIEGIGSYWGLFGPFCEEPFENACGLNCFNKVDTLMFESMGFYTLTDCNHIYTDILEPKSEKSISVFPNPASNFITFDLSNFRNEKFSITIYNSNGNQVNHFTTQTSGIQSSQLQIPISQIGADGLYLYTMNFDNQKYFIGRFLVQR
ncbi:MAG: T9SS type A sorting domain-containing protein [Chitinophagales bacterium]